MMPTYIYCPVMTGEMAAVARSWNDGRTARGKIPYIVVGASDSGATKWFRRKFGTEKLSNVGATDKLYVLAHGLTGASTVGGAVQVGVERGDYVASSRSLTGFAVENGTWKTFTPSNLASHLKKEGLTSGIQDLRLFCCGAGLGGTHGGTQFAPYASRLKTALTGLGFNAVTVTGYLGDLSAERSERFAPHSSMATDANVIGQGKGVKLPGDTYMTIASQHRVRF